VNGSSLEIPPDSGNPGPLDYNTITYQAGLTEAMRILGTDQDCQKLFAKGQAVMNTYGANTGSGLLSILDASGLLRYSSGFVTNGKTEWVSFASRTLDGTSKTNLGGVTTYASGNFVTPGGTSISTGTITLNVDSFVFIGLVSSNGRMTAVGSIAPSAFGGMNQTQIMAAAILHELGHFVGALPSDGAPGQSGLSNANSETIRRTCF